MKLLGIDYGDSKVGLAFGDTESGLASPYKILKNTGWNNLLEGIKEVCKKERIEKVIIGMPVNQQSPEQGRRVQDFIVEFKNKIDIEIEIQDEQFTTAQAKKLLNDSKKHDDDIAAMLILQAYLDA